MLSSFFTIAWFGAAIGTGVAGWSLWWLAGASFLAGSINLSSGPGFDIVMTANRDGRLGVLPRMLALHVGAFLAIGLLISWAARLIA